MITTKMRSVSALRVPRQPLEDTEYLMQRDMSKSPKRNHTFWKRNANERSRIKNMTRTQNNNSLESSSSKGNDMMVLGEN